MKKSITIFLATTFTLAMLTSCRASRTDASAPLSVLSSADNYKVRIAYSTGLCHAPIHVAIENGYFANEGLNFEGIPLDAASTIDAAAAGQIDAGFGLIGKFAQPLENGLPIKLTAGIHTGCTKLLTLPDNGIETVADLRGKTIGVASLTDSPAIVAKRALAEAGVSVSANNMEIEFVVYNKTDLPAALQNGAIAAYADGDPTAAVAVRDLGLHVLVDTAITEGFADEYCCASFVTDDLAEKRPELAAAYTRAVMRAAEWVSAHIDETAKMQVEKQYVSGDASFNADVLRTYNYIPSVEGGWEALTETLDALQEIDVLKADTDTAALAKRSYFRFENNTTTSKSLPTEDCCDSSKTAVN